MGHRPVKVVIQVDEMDADLRAGLWNVFHPIFVDQLGARDVRIQDSARRRLRRVWDGHFKRADDEAPRTTTEAKKWLKPLFSDGPYLDVYDLIEFTVQEFSITYSSLEGNYNKVLEREVSGYRFIQRMLTPISNEYELQAIEDGLAATGSLSAAAVHLQTALKHLSDREFPDYRNSIKESISAIESAARAITGEPSTYFHNCAYFC
jgi:hypothetical protein